MALAEALVRGLPVVSTTGGAISDTVPSGAGVLVPPGDDRALAGALEPLLAEPEGAERRAALGAAASRYGRMLPSWDEAIAAFAKAVLELAPGE
jgi:glycosyltransferase involved in cell wall biosynthesis